ncbi:MAG: HEAT repeat domain-containing protein [Phycisphaerales bacterium]
MKHRWLKAVLMIELAAVASIGAGCDMMVMTGEPWSTKDQSTVGGPLASATLHVEPMPASQNPATGLSDTALGILRQASTAEHAQLRANAIEGLQFAPEHLDPLVRRGLVDDNRGVRFVAAMTIGEYRMYDLAHLLEPMLRDDSESVQAAAIYGLKRCGRQVDLSPLAIMILSDDPEVRANTALVLGDLGNASAIPVLANAVGRGMTRVNAAKIKLVDLQLAEALVKLGAERQIEAIRAALFAPAEQGELTAVACMMCGRLQDERTVPNMVRLARITGDFQQPAEVRMAATWGLAHIDPALAAVEVPMEYVTSDDYQLRFQAAMTLGEIGYSGSLATLSTMMGDQNPLVQVAAATAILQILNPNSSRRDRL